jgi:hypothetical protein
MSITSPTKATATATTTTSTTMYSVARFFSSLQHFYPAFGHPAFCFSFSFQLSDFGFCKPLAFASLSLAMSQFNTIYGQQWAPGTYADTAKAGYKPKEPYPKAMAGKPSGSSEPAMAILDAGQSKPDPVSQLPFLSCPEVSGNSDSTEHHSLVNCWVMEQTSQMALLADGPEKDALTQVCGRYWSIGYKQDGSAVFKKESMAGFWAPTEAPKGCYGVHWVESDKPLYMHFISGFLVPGDGAGWWISSTLSAEDLQQNKDDWIIQSSTGFYPDGNWKLKGDYAFL